MADKPSEKNTDAAEFQRVLGNLANTPHKPHVLLKTKRAPTKANARPVSNQK